MFEEGGGTKGEYCWSVGGDVCGLRNGVVKVVYLVVLVQSELQRTVR